MNQFIVSSHSMHYRDRQHVFGHAIVPVLTKVETFGEVTGILFQNEERSRAVVEYTTIVEPTPFDPIFRRTSATRTLDRSAVFQLYDDGWRVCL